jgi:hypothetical protein
VCGNELSQCSKGSFFCFIGRDVNICVWCVSIVASKFECSKRDFLFVSSSIDGSPPTSILSFFIKDPEAVFDGCWSFNMKFVFYWFCESPLKDVKVEIYGTEGVVIVRVCYVVSQSEVSIFVPLHIFEVSLGTFHSPHHLTILIEVATLVGESELMLCVNGTYHST